ncbi:MarR family winged helix-turn-helix transcriptional regulator [Nonomuraea sediminis]|uniref:MarR family winged helix-turn-helix transcriptional regulator n=1 Tax=Nonomuraea sediminis TaxID=2835864 RepID=UPI00202A96AA|nr:MarR family transcriptional regulator [Nonomuraea sediminis]
MNGLELFLLGHRLIEIGQEAIPRSGFHALPAGARAVLVDAFRHPGSSIGEITERTGLPQSLVSSAVARFRDEGVMTTEPDPADRRRTLVSPAPGMPEQGKRHAATATVDAALARALGVEESRVAVLVETLEELAEALGARAGDEHRPRS